MSRFRRALRTLYLRTFLSALPRLRGWGGLRLLRLVYEDFSIGCKPRCWGGLSVVMEPGSSITIGNRFSSTSDQFRAAIAIYSPTKLRTMPNAEIIIGDDVSLNGTSITSRVRVEIGDGAMLAANVVIVDSDFHPHWPPLRRRSVIAGEYDAAVTLGRNVWIGVGTIILKGSQIGDNTIIAAGSVVNGTIPCDVMAGGVPAKVIRELGIESEGERAR